MAGRDTILSVASVTKRFGGLVAVDDLSFEVGNHEMVDSGVAQVATDERTGFAGTDQQGVAVGQVRKQLRGQRC